MKIKILLPCFFLALLFKPFTGKTQVNTQDSLALVDLYNSTNGPGWRSNWLTQAPLGSWYGISITNGRVDSVNLRGFNLSGSIPASLGNLSSLTYLNLMQNQLTGNIPSSIGNLTKLLELHLSSNQLSGSIPPSLGNLTNLTWIHLTGNQLSGFIPSTLGNLNNLQRLEIGYNQLSGSLPTGLESLPKLTYVSLPMNQLSGSVPSFLGSSGTLTYIDLSSNLITDTLPSTLGGLHNLSYLYLANNQITGNIPSSFGNLLNLKYLYLVNNQITGNIPSSLSKLTLLSSIGLANNNLSGNIPSTLSKLSSLQYFDLSSNHLTFDGIELMAKSFSPAIFTYSPQANIALNKYGNLLSVSAGGTLINDTFKLYKDGILLLTQPGDSVFAISAVGKYYIMAGNMVAYNLNLTSAIDTITGLVIADTTGRVTENIVGTTSVSVEDSLLHKLIVTLEPTAGVNALAGNVTSSVFIDKTISVFNNQPYVQRHYDITPATNAVNAQATVTLYFTQQEFNNFNAYPGHGLSLPTGLSDATGKANLRVYQFHGFSATSLPGTYSGNGVEINPADSNIIWNATSQYWEVSFAVNGFSGFFVSSVNGAILPVKLLSFSGNILDKKAILNWTTTAEINASYYELQRSSSGNSFNAITKIAATGNSNSNLNYQYTDLLGSDPVYFYRLKMVDKDGGFSLSNIVKLSSSNNSVFTIFPNPAKAFVFVNLPVLTTDSKIKISDMTGRILQTIVVKKATSQIKLNTGNLPAGTYKVIYNDGEREVSKMMVIQ
jgi:hypothetical protein